MILGVGSVIGVSIVFVFIVVMGEGWVWLCEGIYMGKIDVDKIFEIWGVYVLNFVDVICRVVG